MCFNFRPRVAGFFLNRRHQGKKEIKEGNQLQKINKSINQYNEVFHDGKKTERSKSVSKLSCNFHICSIFLYFYFRETVWFLRFFVVTTTTMTFVVPCPTFENMTEKWVAVGTRGKEKAQKQNKKFPIQSIRAHVSDTQRSVSRTLFLLNHLFIYT